MLIYEKYSYTHTLLHIHKHTHNENNNKNNNKFNKIPKKKKKLLHSLSYNFFFEVFLLWALKEQKPSKNYNNNKKCKNKTKRLLNTKDGKLIIVYTTPLEFFTADYPSHK